MTTQDKIEDARVLKFLVSVVVCCHNSAGRITETVAHLAKLEKPIDVEIEVIIVDNASLDNTAEIAWNVWREFNSAEIAFRIVTESIPGLKYARMKGIAESRGEYIVFCDDDNFLDAEYVKGALEAFDSYPSIGIVGGCSLPKFSVEGRPWLRDFFTAMAISDPVRESGPTTWVFGAGMVVRKQLFLKLEALGMKLLLSDRKGNALNSGGDAEICYLARCLGMQVFYSSRIRFYHDVSQRRLKKGYYLFPNLSVAKDYIYLYILDQFASGRVSNEKDLRKSFLGKTLNELFHFMPRVIIGRHRFYSYCILYDRLQMLYWMVVKPKVFSSFYGMIRDNLRSILSETTST